MTRLHSALGFIAVFAVGSGGVARADEPAAVEPAGQVEPADMAATPPAAPSPPPAPVIAPAARSAPGAADPDAANARASDARFGEAGQVALTGALSASFGRLGYDSSDNSNTNVSVEPAFDYFASANVSLGASALARYGTSTATNGIHITNTTVGLTGRIGWNLWLSESVSFWPKLAVGAWRNWLKYSAPPDGYTVTIDGMTVPIGFSSNFTEDALFVEIQAPFLFHVARHFFVGFGPDAYVDLLHSVDSRSNRRRFVGASSTVGGWF